MKCDLFEVGGGLFEVEGLFQVGGLILGGGGKFEVGGAYLKWGHIQGLTVCPYTATQNSFHTVLWFYIKNRFCIPRKKHIIL